MAAASPNNRAVVEKRTSNTQHRTLNIECPKSALLSLRPWMFDVGCSMFSFENPEVYSKRQSDKLRHRAPRSHRPSSILHPPLPDSHHPTRP